MITKEPIVIEPFGCERLLHIYVPDDIGDDERLPVLYMFDGHNLFNDEDATFGKSWGMKDYLESHHTRLIVVGLECNHEGMERLDEFSPYSFHDECGYDVHQRGKELAEWMATDLKACIDENYPTIPDREHTYIGGSSMGGLMAMYMIVTYSQIYSKGLAISPHMYPVFSQMRRDALRPMVRNTAVYISWGGNEYETHELFAKVTDQNLQLVRILMKKRGVMVLPHVFRDDDHSEAAWESQLHVWMKELGIR